MEHEESQESPPNLNDIEIDRFLERELQDWLSNNLASIDPNLRLVGIEYPVSVGRIDILAKTKDDEYVVIELKRGIATRDVIGQIQSYIGAIKSQYPDSDVTGLIVAPAADAATHAALHVIPRIRLVQYRREVRVQYHFETPQRKKAPPSRKSRDASWPFPAGEDDA